MFVYNELHMHVRHYSVCVPVQSDMRGIFDLEADLEEEEEAEIRGVGTFGASQQLLGKDGQLVNVSNTLVRCLR